MQAGIRAAGQGHSPASSEPPVGCAASRQFLKPRPLGSTTLLVAWKRRGPRRYFGWTRSQLLDLCMRTNARVSATICFSFFPLVAAWIYRYQTVLKPKREAAERAAQEDLLSEGRYQKS